MCKSEFVHVESTRPVACINDVWRKIGIYTSFRSHLFALALSERLSLDVEVMIELLPRFDMNTDKAAFDRWSQKGCPAIIQHVWVMTPEGLAINADGIHDRHQLWRERAILCNYPGCLRVDSKGLLALMKQHQWLDYDQDERQQIEAFIDQYLEAYTLNRQDIEQRYGSLFQWQTCAQNRKANISLF